ncbi:MAG TPA: AMP-binding protein [Pseudonocardia sp.]|uniref:AMP-binding protein n=1 Tax=Pseudonocardia sp. TaxID=60912 RepID=UPI002F3E3C75
MPIRLCELIARRGALEPRGPFLIGARDNRVLDNAAMASAALSWADELDALDVPPGARVLLDVDDPLAFSVVHLSVIAAGRCCAPIDPDAPEAEIERAFRAIRPSLVLTDRAGRRGVRVDADTGRPLEPVADATATRSPAEAAGSAALLTSGSTGAPKTVVLSEQRLLHVASAVVQHHRLTPADRGFNPLPLFHINAQVVGLLATLLSGSSLVLDRRFHRTGFWPMLVRHDVSWLNAVPAILSVLSRGEAPSVPPRLRFVRSASAPLPVVVREAIERHTGRPVVESYGMTEAASQITATPLGRPARPGSVGRPVGVELDVVAPDGTSQGPGEVGRVRIRGEGVIRGYADGVAADSFDEAHWLDTADLGYLDPDGYLYLVGRADDVVNRGGELVYPRELEEVLVGDPAVAEAVVVGRPHEILGAVPVACVRATEELGAAAEAELLDRLVARCAQRLARYKRPAEILVIGSFPLGPTGKVRRTELRRQVAEERLAVKARGGN